MNIYIVEDHESIRLVLKLLLKKNFGSLVTVGESESAEQALEEIHSFNPDIILVDISLPGMDGIDLIRKLKPEYQKVCILVLTGHEVDLYKDIALEAGAYGIVSKMDDYGLLCIIREIIEKKQRDIC